MLIIHCRYKSIICVHVQNMYQFWFCTKLNICKTIQKKYLYSILDNIIVFDRLLSILYIE